MADLAPDASLNSAYTITPITGGVNATSTGTNSTDYLSAFLGSQSTSSSATSSTGSTSSATFNASGQQTSEDALPGGSLSAFPGGTSITGANSIAPGLATSSGSSTSNAATNKVIIGGVVVIVVIVGGYFLIRSKLDIVKDVTDIAANAKKAL